MTTPALFVTATILLSLYLWWGFTILPTERLQFFATVPDRKGPQGSWQGINFTWYGLLTANAYLTAVATLLVLLGAVGVATGTTALLALALLLCCVPASRLVARLVEKKAHTFTVGGAVFVGILLTPFIITLLNRLVGGRLGGNIPVMAACAAIAIAYAFGEGLGRLACISFGCCYGKPVATSNRLMVRLFSGRGFRFFGSTKKAVYADNLEAVELIPVQALTAVLYCSCGLLASGLFLTGHHTGAFLLATSVTQGWRSWSETLRADYRGSGRISAYQVMGGIGVVYALGMALLLGHEAVSPADLVRGLTGIWHPALLLFLQGIWLAIFYYTGRSSVTGATVSYHVHHDRV